MLNKIAIGLLKAYKAFLSPLMGSHCRFTPTCSTYAMHAFTKYRFFKALWMTARRILKCHPLHPGGYDPA